MTSFVWNGLKSCRLTSALLPLLGSVLVGISGGPANAQIYSKTTINYPTPIPSEIIEADLLYTSDCRVCWGDDEKPVLINPIPIKIVIWLLKFAPPAYSPPDPTLSLLGIAGNEISGNIYMGSALRAAFHQQYDSGTNELVSQLDLANLDRDIPSSYVPTYTLSVEETITGIGAGLAVGNGAYYVDDELIGNYNVDYVFDGAPSAMISSPLEIRTSFLVEPGSTPDVVRVKNGYITGTNMPCPVPGPLPIVGIWVAFGYSRKIRRRVGKNPCRSGASQASWGSA